MAAAIALGSLNPASQAADDPRRNFSIVATWIDGNGSALCLSQVDWDETGRLIRSEVRMIRLNAGRLTRCANHEIVHGLSLHVHPDRPSAC